MAGVEHAIFAASPLRAANHDDAEGVARLLDALGYPCTAADAGERIDAIASDSRQVLLVADGDEGLSALLALDFMYYLPLGRTTCRITALVVAPDHRGRGIGRLLIRETERRAWAAEAARIEVTSAEHREEAHAFYSAMGYRDAARRFVKPLGQS